MFNYTCSICGQEHQGLPAIAYGKPGAYFAIPEEELPTRVFCTADLCSIDNERFFIRAVLELPIRDHAEAMAFGVWVEVSPAAFQRYVELWDAQDVSGEPPLQGLLSGGIATYEDSDRLEVVMRMQSGGQRPFVEVVSAENQLGLDQHRGVTIDQVSTILHLFE